MKRTGRLITFGTVLLTLLWAGSALGNESPKNIIMMIGDGFGFEQAEAGRLLVPGGQLVLDVMDPNPGSVDVSNVFGEITDSAAGATAFSTGCKTENGNVSMAEDDMTVLPTNMEAAQDEKNMAVGILSSVYLCDATPGVWLAHAERRSCSTIIPQQADRCPDVFLGPGEKVAYQRGGRGKNRVDYITDMVKDCKYEQVGNAAELAAAQAPNDRLLGIWGGYTLMYDIDQQNDPSYNLPSLAQMTDKAIEVLKRNENGFFLMVESGAIDWMAHNKDIAGTARDVVAFDEAIAVAYEFAQNDGNTALIVTADHETGGLALGNSPNVQFIKDITASTDFMWGLVHRDGMDVEYVLDRYAGVTDLSQAEKAAIDAYGEMAISDALSDRANVVWGATGIPARAPDEGDHTDLLIPVWAFGPGTESLEGDDIDNTDIGKLLFNLVGVDAPSCPVIGP